MTQVDLLVVHAGHLLTMADGSGKAGGPRRGEDLAALGAIEDGAVAVSGAKVVAVGGTRDLVASFDAERTIDARGAVVLPGFVDTHTHPVFSGSRAWEIDWKVQGRTYREITAAGGGIPFTVAKTRAASHRSLVADATARVSRALAHGTTTLEAKSGYGLSHAHEVAQLEALKEVGGSVPSRLVRTYLGLHERPPEHKADVGPYVDEIRRTTLPHLKKTGLADCVDAFVEQGVYTPDEVRPALVEAKRLGFPLRIHVDEFSDLGGAAFAVGLGARSADHLLSVSDDGIEALAGSDTVATLLPLVPFAVRDPKYAPFRRMKEAGCIIALASDFNPNVACLNMATVVQHAVYGMGMRPAEALVAATANAGWSVAPGTGLGTLTPGAPADLIVTDVADPVHLAYEFGEDPVRAVVVGGRVAVGTP